MLRPWTQSSFLLSSLGQVIAPLAAPHHQGNHGHSEEHRDEDEGGERVLRRVHPIHQIRAAVEEKVLVYVDYVALHQRIGPVAVGDLGLCLRAVGEEVVLTGEEEGKKRMKGLEQLLKVCNSWKAYHSERFPTNTDSTWPHLFYTWFSEGRLLKKQHHGLTGIIQSIVSSVRNPSLQLGIFHLSLPIPPTTLLYFRKHRGPLTALWSVSGLEFCFDESIQSALIPIPASWIMSLTGPASFLMTGVGILISFTIKLSHLYHLRTLAPNLKMKCSVYIIWTWGSTVTLQLYPYVFRLKMASSDFLN